MLVRNSSIAKVQQTEATSRFSKRNPSAKLLHSAHYKKDRHGGNHLEMHASEFTGGEYFVHDNTNKRLNESKKLKNLNSQISKVNSLHTRNTTEYDLNSFRPADPL